jgi:hypothetical protein
LRVGGVAGGGFYIGTVLAPDEQPLQHLPIPTPKAQAPFGRHWHHAPDDIRRGRHAHRAGRRVDGGALRVLR